jgi:ATP-dependent RNA helicase DOB1
LTPTGKLLSLDPFPTLAMNSNLFAMLDDNIEDDDAEIEVSSAPTEENSKKRKADTPKQLSPSPATSSAAPTKVEENQEAGPSSKRPRISEPAPVVVDEIEIEAKREVAASAGLTGSAEAGSRLELRHQVCLSILIYY